ncbi:MAG: YggS family pyridoxal phosphate-dependent enzyme [Bacteroidota bacterium]
MGTIAENIRDVRRRIEQACNRVGRDPYDVTLVAVTKAFDATKIAEAVRQGVRDIGENFAQELLQKRKQLPDEQIRWHFVGHVQTNKVKYIADFVHLIHSVDSFKLAEEIDKRASRIGRRIDLLIEVNTTGEATKHGVRADETVPLVKEIARLGHVHACGLMTMGPILPDPEQSRPCFRILREVNERIRGEGIENVTMTHLSMGMTNDFEVGIEEGATLVRLGTALFGPRPKR